MPRKTINIYEGDDFERLADLRTEVNIAERALFEAQTEAAREVISSPARGGDDQPDLAKTAVADASVALEKARAAFDAFVDLAAERAEPWELHNIGYEAWLELVAAHPARQVDGEGDDAGKQVDDPADSGWGVNTVTFGKALLLFADPEDPQEHRTVTKIGDAPLTELPKRLRRLSLGQFESLWITAFMLNTGGVDDPKAQRYSTGPRSSES
jgi:hypothetical protein